LCACAYYQAPGYLSYGFVILRNVVSGITQMFEASLEMVKQTRMASFYIFNQLEEQMLGSDLTTAGLDGNVIYHVGLRRMDRTNVRTR
jgi:hypothetical protein